MLIKRIFRHMHLLVWQIGQSVEPRDAV